MGCNIALKANNGEPSILFKKLTEANNNHEQAIDSYYFTKTDTFKKEFGDWENGKVDKSKLDKNGEPKFEEFVKNDIEDYEKVELDNKAAVYKKILNEMPRLLGRLNKSIDSQKKFGKNKDLLKKLEDLVPLLESGDIADGIPKFILSSSNHIKSLKKKAEEAADINKLTFIKKAAESYGLVEQLIDKLYEDPEIGEIFDETLLKDSKNIRANLAYIKNLYLAESKKFIATEFSKRNPSWKKADISKWLDEAPRDSKATEHLLEYMGDSQDKVLAAIAKVVQGQKHEIRRERVKLDATLSDLTDDVVKEAKSSKAEDIFKDIMMQDADGTSYVIDPNLEFTNGKDQAQDALYNKAESVRNSKPALYQFLLFYNEEMNKIDTFLPNKYRLNGRIPSVLLNTRERLKDGSLKDKGNLIKDQLSKSMTRSNLDTERGAVFDASGKPIETIPIFYTQKYDSVDYDAFYKAKLAEEIEAGKSTGDADIIATKYAESESSKKMNKLVSKDLANSLQAFHATATNYAKMNEVTTIIEASKDIVSSDKRTYVKLDSAGRVVVNKDKYGDSRPETITGKESTSRKVLETFLSMQVYGQMEKDLGAVDVMGSKIDVNKALRNLNKSTSYIQMTLNALSSSASFFMGNYNNLVEAMAGEFTSVKSYKKASKMYRKNLGSTMSDIGSRKSKGLINQLDNHYAFMGDYDQSNVRSTENSKTARLFKTDALFFMEGVGQHQVQNTMALAVMDDIKAFDKVGNSKGSVLDAHSVGDNGVIIADIYVKNESGELVKYDANQQNQVADKVSTVIRKIQGNYSQSTATFAKQDGRMALVMKYRDWMYEGLVRRFGKKQYNANLGVEVEGFYREGTKVGATLIKHLKTLKIQAMKEDWQNLTPKEKANFIRLVAEVSTIVSLGAISSLMGYAGKHMEDEYDGDNLSDRLALGSFNYSVYLANRLYTETSSLINPMEFVRITKSPTVSSSVLESTIKLAMQMMNPLEVRETGRHKGESELFLAASKLVPMYKNIAKLTPEGIKDSGAFYN